MWILFLVGGGWVSSLVFYLVSKDKPFVRHHAAESLNLFLVLLVPQLVGIALALPDYLDLIVGLTEDPEADLRLGGSFWLGLSIVGLVSLLTYIAAIAAAVQAHRGRWWRLPLPVHPVRGVVASGQEPYSVV